MSLSDSLRAFWKLADTSDAGPNGFTLTNNNTVTFVSGKIGDAARFAAASSQYLSRADHASLSFGNVDFSISVWVKLASTGTARPIVNKNTTEWRLGTTSANKIIFQFPGGGSLTHSLALSGSTWYHVVAWYDAAADLMWIAVNDGTPESAADSAGPVDSTNELRVGRLGTAYWDGDLDALGIWGRVLTPAERAQLYNGGSGIEPPFPENFEATFTETMSLADSSVCAISATFTEALSTADAATLGHARTLSESVTLTDATAMAIARALVESVTLTDEAVRSISRTLSESVTLTDAITAQLAVQLSESLGLADTLAVAIARACVESLTLSDGTVASITRTLSETLSLSDSVAAAILKLMAVYVGAGAIKGRLDASELRTRIEASKTRGGA